MTLPQKPIKWAKTLGYEVGTEAVRRWNCHDPMLAALRDIADGNGVPDEMLAGGPEYFREHFAAFLQDKARAAIAKAETPASDNTELLTALKRLLAAPELHSDWGNPEAMISERTAAREQAAEAIRKAESAT
jgi:hypothetical protein